jgi:hypothetical protein
MLMVDTVKSSETSISFYKTILHGAASQKTVVFISFLLDIFVYVSNKPESIYRFVYSVNILGRVQIVNPLIM